MPQQPFDPNQDPLYGGIKKGVGYAAGALSKAFTPVDRYGDLTKEATRPFSPQAQAARVAAPQVGVQAPAAAEPIAAPMRSAEPVAETRPQTATEAVPQARTSPVAPGLGQQVGVQAPASVIHSQQPQVGIQQQSGVRDAWDAERHNMIRDAHRELMSQISLASLPHLDSVMTPTGNPQAMQLAQEHLAQLVGGDTHGHVAEQQFGGDIHRSPAYQQAMIAQMQAQNQHMGSESRHLDAQTAALNPTNQFELAKRFANDPSLGPFTLAKSGVDPATIQAMQRFQPVQPNANQPAIGINNARQAAAQPGNEALNNLFYGNGAMSNPLVDVLEQANLFPGMSDQGNPNRQMLNSYLKERYHNPRDWQNEFNVNQPYLGGMLGNDAHERDQRKMQLINALKLSPY